MSRLDGEIYANYSVGKALLSIYTLVAEYLLCRMVAITHGNQGNTLYNGGTLKV